jgi:hypothetical protein
MTTQFCAPVAPRRAFREVLRQRVLAAYPAPRQSRLSWLLAPLSVLGLVMVALYLELSPFWSPADYFTDQAFARELMQIEQNSAI